MTTAVAVALLAAGGADAATKHSLDGRRTTTAHYKGDLDSPVIPTEAATQPDPTTPALADCTPGACDIRELHLMLPRGSSAGRFHATVVVDSSLEATLVLYNAEGEVLQRHDWYNSVPNEDDDGSLKYQLDVHVERLSRGLYTLALIDQAGIGSYDATLAWVAHPRPRG